MCFSPEASFVGGIVLSSIGIATIKKIHNSKQIVFASIPFFFGLQQITEGILWLGLQYSNYGFVQKWSTNLFLLLAEVFWPIITPLAVLLMEENKKRKQHLRILLGMGILVAAYLLFCLVYFTVIPQIIKYHIDYNNDYPQSMKIITAFGYLLVTIVPFFVSTIKRINLFGVCIFLSWLISFVFFKQYLTSVWCFFAALISGIIYWILRDSKIAFNLGKLQFLKEQIKATLH